MYCIGEGLRDGITSSVGKCKVFKCMLKFDQPVGMLGKLMVDQNVCAQENAEGQSANEVKWLEYQGISIGECKKMGAFMTYANINQTEWRQKVKPGPEQQSIIPVNRPWKAMKITVAVLNRKRGDCKVVNGMVTGQKCFDCTKKALAKSTGFGAIVTGKNGGHGMYQGLSMKIWHAPPVSKAMRVRKLMGRCMRSRQ